MRIALVNPITQTVDRPERFVSLFGRRPSSPLPTDAEVNTVQLAQAMADLGHEVSLFISESFRPNILYQPRGGLKIVYLPTRFQTLFPPAYIPLLPTLRRELKKGAFDIVQTSELYQPSTFLASRSGIPLFVWEEIDQYFSRAIPRWFQKCHHKTVEKWLQKRGRVIARSRASLKFLKDRGWPKTEGVIPTPVDTNTFKPSGETEEYILVVTRLASDRGLSFLLEVLSDVVAQAPSTKLVVIGRGSHAEAFKNEIARRALSAHIEIRSHSHSHREMKEAYNKSSMTLMTTVGGLYPYSASESMACGKPVVSRFKRALLDLIRDGKTGYLVDTPKQMSHSILELLRHTEKRLQMGEEARRHVLDFCDMKKVAARFLSTYKNHV